MFFCAKHLFNCIQFSLIVCNELLHTLPIVLQQVYKLQLGCIPILIQISMQFDYATLKENCTKKL
jgi:hypothetical protein